MAYLNTYKVPEVVIPPQPHKDTPSEDYDFNFVFPVKLLKTDRVELRPFVPSLHAKPLAEGLIAHPELTEYLPITITHQDSLLSWIEQNRRDPSFLLHAIYTAPPGPDADKVPVEAYVLAGMISMINSTQEHSTSELGWIVLFPQFQRTHVLTHAAGAVMHRILDSTAEGGLGLRRCQWYATSINTKSQNAALRLGFKHEALIRAQRVLPVGKRGIRPGRKGEEREDHPSRDSWLAGIYWEEWENGVRDHLDALMARKQ